MVKQDYNIIKCDDCLRVTYVPDPELHTHVHSKRIAQKLIDVACGRGKIPLDEGHRFYESLYRILPDECPYKDIAKHIMQMKSSQKSCYHNVKCKHFNNKKGLKG